VELAAQLVDRLFGERGARALVHAACNDLARRVDRDVGGLAAHFRDRLRLRAGDLVLGGAGATGELLFDLGSRLGGDAPRIGLCLLDDADGFVLSFALAALVFRQQLLRLVAKGPRAVESRPPP